MADDLDGRTGANYWCGRINDERADKDKWMMSRYFACHFGIRWVAVISVLSSFLGTPIVLAEAPVADYSVFVVEPAVSNQTIRPGEPLPSSCKPDRSLEFRACAGEFEPGSFVVRAQVPLKAVRIEVGKLQGDAGSIPQDAVDIRIVKAWTMGDPWFDLLPLPQVLVKDDSLLVTQANPSPEYPERRKNVAPHGLRDAAELLPVDIVDLKQFWVTIRVPGTARPGLYSTTLRIIPENTAARELALQLEIYPFELLPSLIEYSIFYPVTLVSEESVDWRDGHWTNTAWIRPSQYLAEAKNMLAHGITNPNLYTGPGQGTDGELDVRNIEAVLKLREQAGMGPGPPLYLMAYAPAAEPKDRQLSGPEKRKAVDAVRKMMAWGKQRGYPDIYFAGIDEAYGDRLARERDSFQAIQNGGGKNFVACSPDFYDRIGEYLDLPVLAAGIQNQLDVIVARLAGDPRYAKAQAADRPKLKAQLEDDYETLISFAQMREKSFRRLIDGTHARGYRMFTYNFPRAGLHLAGAQRRYGGLAVWQCGFDGSMTWAYTHIRKGEQLADQTMSEAYVVRTEDGVLDTLHWEGLREGIDDVRYLSTLVAVLTRTAGPHGNQPLLADTWTWLAQLDIATADLAAVRAEMARRIMALNRLPDSESTLANIDPSQIDVVAFPEPWRFKLDLDDQGVREGWFKPTCNVSDWRPIRTDLNTGWDTQGFGREIPAYGWYRAQVPVGDAGSNRKFFYLHFGAADEQAWVYLNGREIFEHSAKSTGLTPHNLWLLPFSASLDANLNRSEPNVLVVRVHNAVGMGGLYKPVHLVASDRKLTAGQVHSVIEGRDLQAH